MRTTYFPTRPSRMSSVLDDFFNLDLPAVKFNLNENWTPKANIQESDDAWHIKLMVPGMKKEDFVLELENNRLVIKAELEESKEDTKYNYREFSVRSFERSFNLPKGMVDEEKISAKYNEGILNIEVPKLEVAKNRGLRTIEIQ